MHDHQIGVGVGGYPGGEVKGIVGRAAAIICGCIVARIDRGGVAGYFYQVLGVQFGRYWHGARVAHGKSQGLRLPARKPGCEGGVALSAKITRHRQRRIHGDAVL